jgi:hypothetical protein
MRGDGVPSSLHMCWNGLIFGGYEFWSNIWYGF